MLKTWNTIGHAQNKRILDIQLESGNFPNCYIFLGPRMVGKKTLALELAEKILHSQRIFSHPDFMFLDMENPAVAGKQTEYLRDFLQRTGLMPQLSEWKVAIIDNAEKMNLFSANALLKKIEEPSGKTVFILVCSFRNFPATVFSRAQTVFFGELCEKDLDLFFRQQAVMPGENEKKYISGSPGKLYQILNNGIAENFFETFLKLEKGLYEKNPARLAEVKKISELEAEEWESLLSILAKGTIKMLEKDDTAKAGMLQIMKKIHEAWRQSRSNMNRKFILQNLII